MGTPYTESIHASHPPSVTSEEDELRGTGVQVSRHVSPQYSERGEPSHAGSSEGQEYVRLHLPYPSELREEVDPSEAGSRSGRLPEDPSRSSSSRRDIPRSRPGPRDPGILRQREPPGENESVADSTEEFIRQPYPPVMPRPLSYYDTPGYPHSSSSGSHGYPHPQMGGVPPGQIVHYAPQQPMPVQYAPQYQMSPQPQMYQPSHHGYPVSHHPGSHVSSPYSPSPYGPPSMMGYPPPHPGYFSPQYAQPYPHPQFMDSWRVQSPPLPQATSPPAAPAPAPATAPAEPPKPAVDPDEIAKRIEEIMLAQSAKETEARMKRDEERAFAERAAAADVASKAERAATEQRIREEAAAGALKAAADAAAAEAERAKREQIIRQEAAAAALKAAADEAAAKAERAQKDAKIADEAAAAARTEAEKKAADEAAKNKEESEKKQKEAEEKQQEAEKKLKEAEEAAAKAKAEAEEANKKADAAVPQEKKAPIRFHDAVGRKFNFPFELCIRWRGMESLINQAFQHVEVIGEHVQHGHYDLVGPTGEIILPALWEAIIEPDWVITMHMWPMPEKKEEEMPMMPPHMDDMGGILNMDEILGISKPKGPKSRGSSKRSKSRPGGFSAWMMGGAPSKGKSSLKGDKKPDLAAGSQHGAPDQGACTVM